MICKKCGNEIADDSIFCTECGASVNDSEPTDETAAADNEATSILPHIDEVIADNEETLSLTQEQVQLLSDEPTELLSTTAEESEQPESEPIPEPDPIPPAETSFDELAEFPKSETPPPLSGTAPDSFNDNSDTMRIPIQPEPYSSYNVHTNQFSGNAPKEAEPTEQPPVGIIPPEPQPVPGPAPVPEAEQTAPQPAADKAKPRKKVGGGRIFGASLVTIFTALFLLVFDLLLAVKVGANGDVIRKRAGKLDPETLLTAQYDGNEFAKTFYDSMGFRTATRGNADETGFKRFMINADFTEYMGEVAGSYFDFIIDGDGSDPTITSEDFVEDFIKENKGEAVKEFDYDFADEDYKLIAKNLDKDDFSDSLSISEWNDSLGFEVDKLSYVFSYITIGIIAAIVLLFLIWTAIIVDRRAKHVTGFFGFVFTFTGALMMLGGLTILIGSALCFTFTHHIGYYLAESLLLPFTLLVIIIGAAELLLGFIFRRTYRAIRKKAKKAAAAAAEAANS